MSDLGAAAAALGVPESLVERSVAARASASGVSVDELLTEWAGGEAAPKPAASSSPVPEEAQRRRKKCGHLGSIMYMN